MNSGAGIAGIRSKYHKMGIVGYRVKTKPVWDRVMANVALRKAFAVQMRLIAVLAANHYIHPAMLRRQVLMECAGSSMVQPYPV